MRRREKNAQGRISVALLGITGLCLLALWALVWFGLLAAMGQFRNLYAQIRVAPKAVVWVHLKRNRMRTAPTRELLESAKWIRPEYSAWEAIEFPPVEVPVSGLAEEWDEAEVYLSPHGSACEADWRLRRTDEAGVEWERQVSPMEIAVGGSPDKAPVTSVPRIGRPMLEVDAFAGEEDGGRTVEVALTLLTEQGESLDIARNGRKVDALVRVLDSEGRLVASKRAPLKEFEYT